MLSSKDTKYNENDNTDKSTTTFIYFRKYYVFILRTVTVYPYPLKLIRGSFPESSIKILKTLPRSKLGSASLKKCSYCQMIRESAYRWRCAIHFLKYPSRKYSTFFLFYLFTNLQRYYWYYKQPIVTEQYFNINQFITRCVC